MTPGWTTATRLSRSISRIRSIAVKAIVRAPSMPVAPPDRPVPAPRGTTGTRNSVASRSSSDTWAVSVGSATARGRPGWRWAVSSWRYDSRSIGSLSRRRPGRRDSMARRNGSAGASSWVTGEVYGAATRGGWGSMARMARPSIIAAALTLAVVALLLPAAAPNASAASSLRLDATYDSYLEAGVDQPGDLCRFHRDGRQRVRRRHRPHRVQHDRRQARCDAAPPRDR